MNISIKLVEIFNTGIRPVLNMATPHIGNPVDSTSKSGSKSATLHLQNSTILKKSKTPLNCASLILTFGSSFYVTFITQRSVLWIRHEASAISNGLHQLSEVAQEVT